MLVFGRVKCMQEFVNNYTHLHSKYHTWWTDFVAELRLYHVITCNYWYLDFVPLQSLWLSLQPRNLHTCTSVTSLDSQPFMAAAQNVRSGSSPGPTHDPDLRSRPLIQTFRKDSIQTFDPDLWNDTIYWRVDVWSRNGCMFLGFLLCSYSPCQAAKQQTVVKPRCQAVKLPSCTLS